MNGLGLFFAGGLVGAGLTMMVLGLLGIFDDR